MATRRGKKVEVYVVIGKDLKYGFMTQQDIHSRYKAVLGQTTYAGAEGVFFGANRPKPPRASIETANGTDSSFCSVKQIDALEKAGWQVKKKTTLPGVRKVGKTRTVFVPMPGGYNYCWNIQTAMLVHKGDLSFQEATASTPDLVMGINNPKPPRAMKKINGESYSTFIAPQQSALDKAINAGWTITSVDYDLIPDAAEGG